MQISEKSKKLFRFITEEHRTRFADYSPRRGLDPDEPGGENGGLAQRGQQEDGPLPDHSGGQGRSSLGRDQAKK